MTYEQQQQQPPAFSRPSWNNNRNNEFNRPSFNRPQNGPQNPWNKDSQRPNRDPRTLADRDPRTRPESSQSVAPPSHVSPKETTPALTKGSQPVKELHPNKLKQINDKEIPKKRTEVRKMDLTKEKSKDKHKDGQKNNKDKKKSKESKKLTEVYGTIDAKKAIKGAGLPKFKIPKKRSSIDSKESSSVSCYLKKMCFFLNFILFSVNLIDF